MSIVVPPHQPADIVCSGNHAGAVALRHSTETVLPHQPTNVPTGSSNRAGAIAANHTASVLSYQCTNVTGTTYVDIQYAEVSNFCPGLQLAKESRIYHTRDRQVRNRMAIAIKDA